MDRTTPYDRKLERILTVASRVMADKGYHRASIRDIAAATGSSLAGLYHYFRSKEELLFLIQSHCFTTFLGRLREELAPVDDPEDRLRVVVRNHFRFFVEHPAEMKILYHEADSLTGEFQERLRSRKREYAGIVRHILRDLVPPADDVEMRVSVFSLFGMLNWIYTWYREGRDPDVERLAEEMVDLFLHGYLASRGAPARAPSLALSPSGLDPR